MKILMKSQETSKIDLFLIILTILFFIFRVSNPLFKYPFIILYSYLIFKFSILAFKYGILGTVKKFIGIYLLPFFLLVLLIISFFCSDKLYLLVFKEIISIIILFSLIFLVTITVTTPKEIVFFYRSFLILVVFFGFIISFFGLLDQFGVLPYKEYFLIGPNSESAYYYDYNFGLLPALFSIIVILFYLLEQQKSIKFIFYTVVLLVLSLFILLSGSKRGFTVTVLFYLISIITISIFSEKVKLKNRKLVLTNILLVFLVFIGGGLLFSNLSFPVKNKILLSIGTKDLKYTKERISNNLYRISYMFCRNITLSDFHNKLWSIEMDPTDPDKGWGGIRTYKTIFPLQGKNKEIVPPGSKGSLMDSSYHGYTWDNDVYSITLIGRLKSDSLSKISTSIFCFVSEDFSGDYARLILLYTKRNEIHCDYDLSKKGTWQKLGIEDSGRNEISESRFYFAQKGKCDFSSLKGYVIIAYPQINKLSKSGVIIESYYKNSPGNDNVSINRNSSEKSNIYNAALLIPRVNGKINISLKGKTDPVRKFVEKIFCEDTVYHGYKMKVKKLPISPSSFDDRTPRWRFAVSIFKNEYDTKQKIFGHGFNFLNWYGYYFLDDKTTSDYPHNPFLHVLLYSGILGLLLYCFFLYKVFYYYIKYIKEYPLLFIFFLITFFFSFFSSGTPFDPLLMGFFSMLPFFIHTVHKKDNDKPVTSSSGE